MNIRYMGVYWTPRKEKLPEDATLCVFHIKGNRADRIHFGGYSERFKQFLDVALQKWWDQRKVGYWMPIPILPTEEGEK